MRRNVPSQWVRGPTDELAISEGCYFDPDYPSAVCAFLETFCRQSIGQWKGQPLALMEWQRDFLWRLHGWRLPDGRRRHRRFGCLVAKKNGKSTMLSGQALENLVCEDEGAPEIYVLACDKKQAGIIYREADRMVRASPDLMKRLKLKPSEKLITYPSNYGSFCANSRVVDSKDGFNPSLSIFDELHRQGSNRGLWDVFRYGSISRSQPLMGWLSTAGDEYRGVWAEQVEYTRQVNDGVVPDMAHLGVLYRAEETDDPEDPATWRKANPSMGVTMREEDFRADLLEAKSTPQKWANFLRLRLNIVSNADRRFLNLDRWDACDYTLSADQYRALLDSLAGRVCYGGLDLSTTTDLTAYARLFAPSDPDGPLILILRFWAPGDQAAMRERRDQVPYRQWARSGWITLTDGDVVDYGELEREVAADVRRFDLKKVLADPYNATKTCLDLQAQGVPVEFLRQGFLSLSNATKELERLVLQGRLKHGGHPVLRWNASNAIVETDAAGNIKLSKRKSTERIDGLAATVNALAAYLADPVAEASVYGSRGLFVL